MPGTSLSRGPPILSVKWEPGSGGFPWLNATGSFLIKDVTLLGVSLVVLGESLARLRGEAGSGPDVVMARQSRLVL